MSDIYVGKATKSMYLDDPFSAYTSVCMYTDTGQKFRAGDDTGLTMWVKNPYASQEAANRILASLGSAQYQPYDATGAVFDPAAELGDSVSIHGMKSAIYTAREKYSALYTADISAPGDESINSKIPYIPPLERMYVGLAGELTEMDESVKRLVAWMEGFDGEAGFEAYVKKDDLDELFASSESFARIWNEFGEVSSGLSSKVSTGDLQEKLKAYTLNTSLQSTLNQYLTVSAANEMYVTEDGVSSIIGQYIITDANGNKRSLAQILANQIELNGLTNVNGDLRIYGGSLRVKTDIEALSGTVVAKTIAASQHLNLAGEEYTPQQITSTDGKTHSVLGR